MSDSNLNPNKKHEEVEEENKISELEMAGNTADESSDIESDDQDDSFDRTDYSSFGKQDFVNKSAELIDTADIAKAHQSFKKMRILFDDMLKVEREELMHQFVAEGNEPRDFRVPVDELKTQFYANYTRFLEKRAEEKDRAEKEKKLNLKLKKEILDKIKALTEGEETEKSLDELKDLQRQWKQIGRIPAEQMHDLWETYRYLLDKFYDKLSIFNELKDLDRQKNLEAKIELIKNVGELENEKSIKRSHILLNKYHEEFKNIGPVPKEFSEELWNRFKTTSDAIIDRNKAKLEELKDKRKANLDIKTLLCEKAEQIAEIPGQTPKDWNNKQKELEAIFEEWKKTGPVPEPLSDQIWKRYREAQNKFYKEKKDFYAYLNKDREENYSKKVAICEQAEALSSSNDFEKVGTQLIQLQEKWKSIGPVPEKLSEEVWQRFRTACDAFFKRRDISRKSQNEEEKQNLEQKNALLEELTKLSEVESDNKDEVFETLRGIQKKWNAIGFVPKHKFHMVREKYEKLSEKVLKTHKLSGDEFKQSRMKEHLEMLAAKPDGNNSLKYEERKVKDRIRVLKSEIETLQNNIGFFANSKSADKLLKQFEDKIKNTETQIAKLESEAKMIRNLMK